MLIPDVWFFLCCFYGNTAALHEQRNASAAGIGSTVGESSPADCLPSKDKLLENFEPLGFHHILVQGESCQEKNAPSIHTEFHIENEIETVPNLELQFIPSLAARSSVQMKQENHLESKNLSALRNGSDEEICVSLQLGEPESKRRKHFNCSFDIEESGWSGDKKIGSFLIREPSYENWMSSHKLQLFLHSGIQLRGFEFPIAIISSVKTSTKI